MDVFFEIHRDLPREAPGDTEFTRRAFSLLGQLSPAPRILDVGCGPGAHTVDLAKWAGGEVVGIDTHGPFLEALKQRAAEAGVAEHVTALEMSMFEMTFPEKSFDVIWSEGAIYIIGFEDGLRAFRRFLKDGGYLVASEISWLKPHPPEEIKAFWDAGYPGMKSVAENLDIAKRAGYQIIGHFTLPETCWLDNYYVSVEKRIAELREKYQGNAEAVQVLDAEQVEIELYRKYSDWYSYEFYILQAP